MKIFPELITKRLKLRRIQLSDVPSLLKYVNNKKISDQILNIPFPYQEEDAIYRLNFIIQGFQNKDRYVFAITLKDENELIGEIGLHIEKDNNNAQFGYWVAEPFWGKGIATEATAAILKFGFEKLNLHKIYATHYPGNKASGKVMLNNKMIKEAELKDHYKINNRYRSVIQYRLTKQEYANRI
ncbi:MAG TPA: GNAT family protein [Chitinophagaceae bacterium]|jgi:RimJ/RimL family protein N-acetyltransferase